MGIYKFGNNTYPQRIRCRSNLGDIFQGKNCVLWAQKYSNTHNSLVMKTYNCSHIIIISAQFNQVGTQVTLQQYKKHSHKSCKTQNIRKQVTRNINEEKRTTEISNMIKDGGW